MSHWRTMFADEKYLGAYSLEKDGKYEPVIVTIESIYVGDFLSQGGKEQRPFARLKEFDKPMVMNRTNFKRLEKFFQSFSTDDYIGKQIVLGVEVVGSPDGPTPALRFSTRPIPQKTLPALTDAEFEKAKENIVAGKSTLAKVKSARTLTPEQEEELSKL